MTTQLSSLSVLCMCTFCLSALVRSSFPLSGLNLYLYLCAVFSPCISLYVSFPCLNLFAYLLFPPRFLFPASQFLLTFVFPFVLCCMIPNKIWSFIFALPNFLCREIDHFLFLQKGPTSNKIVLIRILIFFFQCGFLILNRSSCFILVTSSSARD